MNTDDSRKLSIVELDRSAPREEVKEQHSSWLTEHAVTALQAGVFGETPAGFDIPQTRTTVDPRELETLVDRHRFQLRPPMNTMEFSVSPGCRILGTPYDHEWQLGGGFAFGGRHDGEFMTFALEGFSAAGVGFYLSSPTTADVTVTPNGDYTFSTLAAGDASELFSQGGLGITVYLNQNATPEFSRFAQLWDHRGDIRYGKLFGGATGSGSIASAASPTTPGMFGPARLAPILLRLKPGDQYLIWIWSWQKCHRGKGFFAILNARMPAVTACAGPPIVGPN